MQEGNMNEREFLTKFRKIILKKFPDIFYYKIPDTGQLGGKKPFDVIIIYRNRTFCFEAKRDIYCVPTNYQYHMLNLAQSNGATMGILNPENYEMWIEQLEKLKFSCDHDKTMVVHYKEGG
jgi:hypothetical protein